MNSYDESKRRAWAGHASAYARTFAHLCAHTGAAVIEAAGVGPGVHLLDVGTGTGTVAVLGLACGAHVTAVDPDPDMRRLARLAAAGAHVRAGALPRLPLGDATVDAVTANFVLNHVGDPGAAVAELTRVARPGARLAATVWPRPLNPLHQLWEDVLDAAGVERPAPTTLPSTRDFERTTTGLGGLFAAGGLRDVDARTVEFTHKVDPETWWSGPASGVATVGAIVVAQSPETILALKGHYDRLSRRYLDDDGLLHLPGSALLVSGTAP